MALVDLAASDGVLTVTLSRPHVLNPFTRELHVELQAALEAARGRDVDGVVVTGSGRGFCVGQDLEEIKTIRDVQAHLRTSFHPTIRAIHALAKPVVAAVNGIAAGAGVSLALACRYRVAAQSARFIPGFVGIGLVPDSGFTYFLPRLIGEARALEWSLTNRALTASDARAWGLVDEVVDDEALVDKARAHALARIAEPGV
jgi:2-(1,2-epoxy-1,2-dihydrophenyl)acetyl-CoA isomerase